MHVSFRLLVEKQRKFFRSGATLKIEERKKLLRTLKKILESEYDRLTEAVYKDLRRRPELTYSLEISNVLVEIEYVLEYLDDWASPEKARLTISVCGKL
uniref:Cell division topological specificity factor MinE n=1 Tax=Syphacia muris TaxID=451379 RepID=A0A0N5AC27_9BILA